MRKEKLQLISLKNITIEDEFWSKYTKLVTKEIIPYQWDALNNRVEDADPSYSIENFKVAAGLSKGTFHGYTFQDSDLAKWLEAVAYSLSYEENEELEKIADEVIDLVEKAQEEDGYLNTHFSILYPDKKFTHLREGHELYTAGHFMEAAIAYYKATGKDKFLKIMGKKADLICEVFHTPKYENAVPGHEEIELALVKMYEVTGKESYLNMAKDFVERRGREPNYLVHEHEQEGYIDDFNDAREFFPEYSQCHLPVREQKTAQGHAVRATYLYSAMVDLAYEYQDQSLVDACEELYNNIVKKRMYITGAIGSSGINERFTTDYDLPNNINYGESCASIGLAMFTRRMAQITGNAKYVETMERALINTVLAGIAMDGKSFFYVNPLEVWPDNCLENTSMYHVKPVRQKWFGVACCPPNITRTLASLGEYACFTEENSLWINLFIGGKINTEFNSVPIAFEISTKFPFDSNIKIKAKAKERVNGKLYIRIPEYAENPLLTMEDKKVKLNTNKSEESKTIFENQDIKISIDKGYAVIEGRWQEQIINLDFDMPAHFVYSNPQVRENVGKTAIVKGPLVFCLEEVDNGKNLSNLFIDNNKPLIEEYRKDILGGVLTIKAQGMKIREKDWQGDLLYSNEQVSLEETELTLVPYCNWGNRETGEMSVWMKLL